MTFNLLFHEGRHVEVENGFWNDDTVRGETQHEKCFLRKGGRGAWRLGSAEEAIILLS